MGSWWKRETHETTNERERGSRRSGAREIDLTERGAGVQSQPTQAMPDIVTTLLQ